MTVDGGYKLADYARAFPGGYEQHFWHRARLRVVTGQLAAIGVAGTVLDIGCGPGAYVKALMRSGYDCVGCDPGDVPFDAELGGRVFGRTSVGELAPDVRARVDVALMLDVIEHTPDPVALLADVVAALPALRVVVLTVPARQELWSELDRQAGHQKRFARRDLREVVERAGLAVSDIRYLFRALYPFAWIGRRRAARSVAVPAYPSLHAVAGWVLAMEQRIVPHAVPGTSVLCIARRRSRTSEP